MESRGFGRTGPRSFWRACGSGLWSCAAAADEAEGGNAARPRLLDASGGEVGRFVPAPGGGAAFVLRLTSPRLWSDEDPYLYSLDLGDGRRAAMCGASSRRSGVLRDEMVADAVISMQE